MTRVKALEVVEDGGGRRGDETWDGGFVRYGKNGRPTYYIRRSVDGKRYQVSTGKHTEDDAKEELREFLRDPEGYVSGGSAEGEALYLTPDLIQRFLDWSEKPTSEGGKGNSPKWRTRQKKLIEWWTMREVERATEEYLRSEKALAGVAGSQAVLVSVESIEALKRAFPNYFVDTRRFVEAVNSALR